MRIYTFSEARQNFASILEKAKTEGRVLIKRKVWITIRNTASD